MIYFPLKLRVRNSLISCVASLRRLSIAVLLFLNSTPLDYIGEIDPFESGSFKLNNGPVKKPEGRT